MRLRVLSLISFALLAACSGSAFETASGTGGVFSVGGQQSTSATAAGGSLSSGGVVATGGSSGVRASAGGEATLGGSSAIGGGPASGGGTKASGGSLALGGITGFNGGSNALGGSTAAAGSGATGGASTSSSKSIGGHVATGGGVNTGGNGVTGGLPSTGGASVTGNTGGAVAGGESATGGAAATGGGSTGGTTSVDERPGAACTADSDCKLFSDCCTCDVYAAAANPVQCNTACKQSQCDAMGITDSDIACIAGRCVFSLSCDTSKVLCEVMPPQCGTGKVPSVNDAASCYGPCLPVGRCAAVTSCKTCEAARLPCVRLEESSGPTYHCVLTPENCGAEPTCECMAVCSAADGYVCNGKPTDLSCTGSRP